jgi:hypothetical protein
LWGLYPPKNHTPNTFGLSNYDLVQKIEKPTLF